MDVLAWAGVAAVVVALLVVDLAVFSRGAHTVSLREAGAWSVVWLGVGLGFALVVWGMEDVRLVGAYLAGYLIERSLSVDNVFVFAFVLTYFAVPAPSQGRILFFGVLAALVLRAAFIAAGVVVLDAFHWMDYVFGAFLLATAYRMFRTRAGHPDPERNPILRWLRRVVPTARGYHDGRFVVRHRGRLRMTPMVVVLVAVAAVDVAFAMDSIPAIFAVTRDPFVVFTSNAFAILGLRALYFLLAGAMDRFVHLKVGLAAVLALVGTKMLVAEVYEIPVWASLAAIVMVLGFSMVVSLRRQGPVSGGAIDEPGDGCAQVDRSELAADRRDRGGSEPARSGRRDARDAGAGAGGDRPRARGPRHGVRVGAPSPGESPRTGAAHGRAASTPGHP